MGFILPTVKRLQCEFASKPGLVCEADDSPADERLEGQDTQLEVQTRGNIVHFATSAMTSPGGLGGELPGLEGSVSPRDDLIFVCDDCLIGFPDPIRCLHRHSKLLCWFACTRTSDERIC
jgi:hypothetical protein